MTTIRDLAHEFQMQPYEFAAWADLPHLTDMDEVDAETEAHLRAAMAVQTIIIEEQDAPANDSGIEVGDRVDTARRKGLVVMDAPNFDGDFRVRKLDGFPLALNVSQVVRVYSGADADAVEAAQEADIARREQADAEVYGGGWVL